MGCGIHLAVQGAQQRAVPLYSVLSSPYFLAFSAVVITFAAQVASVVEYMVCGLFSSGFITNFVVVTILLMLDFWTARVSLLCLAVASFLSCCLLPARPMCALAAHPRNGQCNCLLCPLPLRACTHGLSGSGVGEQTKNVAGRLLVGLRYWNEVTDEGSNWRFETLEAARTHPCMQGKAYADMLCLQLRYFLMDLGLLAGFS